MPDAVMARMGGDEFAAALPPAGNSPAQAARRRGCHVSLNTFGVRLTPFAMWAGLR
jgi:GGDEF domain-containing protein